MTAEHANEFNSRAQEATAIRTAELIRFLFKAPSTFVTTLSSCALTLAVAFTPLFENSKLVMNLYSAVVIFLIPTLSATILSILFSNFSASHLNLRRASLLSFIALIIICSVALGAYTVSQNIILSLILSYCSILWFRHIVAISVSNYSHLRSLPISIIQTLIGLAACYVVVPFTTHELILSSVLIVIFLSSVILLAELAKIPIRKNYNYNAFKLLNDGIAHFSEHSLELERFFEINSEEIDADIGILCFRARATKDIKALVIIPSHVHPGPFGTLCGSDLPAKLYSKLNYPALVMHSFSTHDYNPATTEECMKLGNRIKQVIAEYSNDCSAHGSKFCVKHSSSDRADISTQWFGNAALVVVDFKIPIDDIDLDIEYEARNKLKHIHDNLKIFFVDAHSRTERYAHSLYLNSEDAQIVLKDLIDLFSDAYSRNRGYLKVGYARRKLVSSDIGALGVQALVLEVNSQKVGYVLFDGNGMVPNIHDTIKNSLESSNILEHVQILTTDNHSVNISMHGFNPVGSSYSNADYYISAAKEVVEEALKNLEDAEVSTTIERFKLKIAGRGSTLKFTSAISKTLSRLKILFPATLLITILVSYIAVIWIYK